MIDYEKLKTFYELDDKIGNIEIKLCYIQNGTLKAVFDDVENLMDRLKELAKPEPKYKVGDTVWFSNYEIPEYFIIDSFRNINDDYEYSGKGAGKGYTYRAESILHPTRQALIEHKLQYWQSLYEPPEICEASQYVPDTQTNQPQVDVDKWQNELKFSKSGLGYIDRCQHQPDFNAGYHPTKQKCVKCGEFYR